MPLTSRPSQWPRTRRARRGHGDYEKAAPQAAQAQGLAVTEIREPGPDQAAGAGSGLPMSVPRLASASDRTR